MENNGYGKTWGLYFSERLQTSPLMVLVKVTFGENLAREKVDRFFALNVDK